MAELENLEFDILLFSNDELEQNDDLAEQENIIDTSSDDLELIGPGCDHGNRDVNDPTKVNFPVSLLVRGKVIPCIKSLVLESEYLSNMAEMFENSVSLPVPEIVSVKDIKEITKFVQLLSPGVADIFMFEKISAMDLEHKIHLLIICDLLGFIKIRPHLMSSIKNSVKSDNWKLVYSRCSTIMGLSSIVDHLLEFLLHQIVTEEDSDTIKDLTRVVSVQFMGRILEQTKYHITEEVKFEFVMDWGSCGSGSEEDFLLLLSMIQFKCFSQVIDLQQAKSDLAQLGVLSSENLSEILRKLEEAINFQLKEWDLVAVDKREGALQSVDSTTFWGLGLQIYNKFTK